MHISFTQVKNHAHELKFDSMFHASNIGLGRYAHEAMVIGFKDNFFHENSSFIFKFVEHMV